MNENNNMMGMSPFEQFMVAEKTSKRPGATAVTGIILGSVGLAVGVGAWIFSPLYANARAKAAEAKNEGTAALLNQTAALLAAERAERVQGDITLNATINDSVSGSQQGSLTATQQAQLDAYQQMIIGLGTGEYSKNPQKVELMTPAQPFKCGCGCDQQ